MLEIWAPFELWTPCAMFCAHVLACVRVFAANWVLRVLLSLPYSCASLVINTVRARGSNLWRFLANGKKTIRKNTVVFKLIIGSLERGWVQPSSIGMPQRGGRQVLYLAKPRDKPLCLLCCLSLWLLWFARARSIATWFYCTNIFITKLVAI